MRTLAIGFLALAGAVYGQFRGGLAPQPYGSVSGFGSVLFPGLGHAPLPNGTAGLYGGFGSYVHPGGFYGGIRPVYPGNTVGNRRFDGRGRGNGYGGYGTAIVPYPVVTGGYYGYDPEVPPQQAAPPQTVVVQQPTPAAAPNITINQYFKSDGTPASDPSASNSGIETGQSAYQGYQPPQRRTAAEEKATIYLIAFKDQTIMPALGYWVEGDTLNYITRDGTHNTASMSLIDRKFSQQLNDERQIEFSLR
jgi:hypothetical protein